MSAKYAKLEPKVEIHENTFDGSVLCSTASEFLGVTDGSFAPGVTYKLIPVKAADNSGPTMPSSPSHSTYYVSLANPVEVYAPATIVKNDRDKKTKREPTPQQSKATTAKKRDDKRRATHNEVERRRRDKINTWIMKLGALVPDSVLPDSASKGGILAKACDYITELKDKQKRLQKVETENEKLVLEVLRLNQELADLRKENTSVRNQLADNCIVFTQRHKDDKS